MKLSNKRLWLFGVMAIGAIILITLLAAPANNKLASGSTYNRTPEGYGAWYAFMSKQEIPIQRWRKPFEDLAANKTAKTKTALLRVNHKLEPEGLLKSEQDWIRNGNTLVVLGVSKFVIESPFTNIYNTEFGSVKIDTQRRMTSTKGRRLGDKFGTVVWEEKIGAGRVIYATTPHLAANAYQDYPGNYKFLAQLVSEKSQTIWVDEYRHGYKDSEEIKREQKQDIFSYLAQTPVFPALIQVGIILLVSIWAGNRRFGKPLAVSTPAVDNSQAYIQALAGVLQKAESSEFILEVVGKEEQLQLQKALFLGQTILEPQILIDAWVKQTGRPAEELPQLQLQSKKRRISETELLAWLTKWKQINRHLPFKKTNS